MMLYQVVISVIINYYFTTRTVQLLFMLFTPFYHDKPLLFFYSLLSLLLQYAVIKLSVELNLIKFIYFSIFLPQ